MSMWQGLSYYAKMSKISDEIALFYLYETITAHYIGITLGDNKLGNDLLLSLGQLRLTREETADFNKGTDGSEHTI